MHFQHFRVLVPGTSTVQGEKQGKGDSLKAKCHVGGSCETSYGSRVARALDGYSVLSARCSAIQIAHIAICVIIIEAHVNHEHYLSVVYCARQVVT